MRLPPAMSVSALVLTAMVASSCGQSRSDGENTAAAGQQTPAVAAVPRVDPQQTIETLFSALADGDGDTACALYSPEYANEKLLDADQEVATCEDMIANDGPNEFYDADNNERVLVLEQTPETATVGVGRGFGDDLEYTLYNYDGVWKVRF